MLAAAAVITCGGMLGHDTQIVGCADPSQHMFYAFKYKNFSILSHASIYLQSGVEQDLPDLKDFDTVFSMGVLYHRKSLSTFCTTLKHSVYVKRRASIRDTGWWRGRANRVYAEDRMLKCAMFRIYFDQSLDIVVGRVWVYKILESLMWLTPSETAQTAWMKAFLFAAFYGLPHKTDAHHEGYPRHLRAVFISWNNKRVFDSWLSFLLGCGVTSFITIGACYCANLIHQTGLAPTIFNFLTSSDKKGSSVTSTLKTYPGTRPAHLLCEPLTLLEVPEGGSCVG